MGNQQSSPFRKLDRELPPVKQMGLDENSSYTDLGMKVFANEDDRKGFIHAIIAVMSENGKIDIEEHDFRLLYSRRENNEDRIIARIVAIKEGVIRAKIEPTTDGANQTEAFKAFRRDIEVQLDRILQTIPSGSSPGLKPSGIESSKRSGADAPPAYSSPGASREDRKKG